MKSAFACVVVACLLVGCGSRGNQVVALRCESLADPVGVETAHPRLSWEMRSSRAGERQTAYQIVAGTSPGAADLWDTGRVEGDRSINVPYAGRAAPASTPCYWRVRTWDAAGRASAWSGAATWESGPAAWAAKWVRPVGVDNGPLLRRSFHLDRPVRSARAYVCGLGYYEVYLNGAKVGDHVLDPAQTDYDRRALYASYDVTPLLRAGDNAAGLMIGTGFFDQRLVWGGMSYGRPCAIVQLQITYADGTSQTVGTDDRWRCAAGPIARDNVYAGETYDARREIPGWDTAGFNDEAWKPVEVIPSPTPRLESQLMPPVKAVRTITPVAVTHPKPGVTVYDLGENVAGWAKIGLTAPAGTTVKLRFAETVFKDGTVDTASTGVFATNVEQVDSYTAKGTGRETWEPRFTYHGGRYIEVTGHDLDSLEGVVVHTAVATAGAFACSDAALNRIHGMAIRSELSNLQGTPTDCPAREKCGWLGDAHATTEMTMNNFGMARVWPKYVRDIETSLHTQMPGEVAPGKRCSVPDGNTDYGVALVMIPWFQYLYYGDTDSLREHYPHMREFVRAVHGLAKENLVSKGYGDWCPPGGVEPVETPVALTTTAWAWRGCTTLARIAALTGHDADVAEYRGLAAGYLAALNAKYFDAAKETYGSQTANAIALAWGLVPAGHEQAVADSLAREVTVRHNTHQATGIIGSRQLFAMLARYGHADVAMAVLRQTTYPSIGYNISRGATTFWECWGEEELDKKWGARSLNHPMQGGFDAWFYQGVLGINPDPERPAFKHVILRPDFATQLSWATGSYHGPYGAIRSDWRRDGGTFHWHVEIPPNSTATAYLPDRTVVELSSGAHDLSCRVK